MEDFVKEKVQSIEKSYAHSGVYVVTLNPEYRFNSAAAPHKISFETKADAMQYIRQAQKVAP
jgi:outer membrane protein assembly factor BamA